VDLAPAAATLELPADANVPAAEVPAAVLTLEPALPGNADRPAALPALASAPTPLLPTLGPVTVPVGAELPALALAGG
jgi:hypothetical protein